MSAANQTRPFRVVIACGGTGGHLFPGIAVAQEARRRGWETLLLISSKQIDALAVQGHEDLRFEKVPAVAMPSPLSPAMVKFLWRFWKTRRQCLELIRGFGADAVLGMGGFTSLPPAMAGRITAWPMATTARSARRATVRQTFANEAAREPAGKMNSCSLGKAAL
jgi:UDP-N-acetylglucosamine--N-acetylmuramyl-(pentapeptide) pyrophosphoryl-undecaprenol N-acetylglucosamine transferase